MERTKTDARPALAPPTAIGRLSTSDPSDGPRRLQRMGAVTVGVSLPRVWVGEHGLAPGSTVHLSQRADGSLILRHLPATSSSQRAAISVAPGISPEHLFRQLVAAYLAGASEFVVEERPQLSAQTRSIVRTFARRTIQPEVESETDGRLVLKDVSLGVGFSVPQLLHRMYQLVVELQTEGGRSWQSTRAPPSVSLATRDDEADRHAWLIERVIGLQVSAAHRGGSDRFAPMELLESLLLTRALERIADHAVTIGEYGALLAEASLPPRVTGTLTSYHRQALDHLAQSFEVTQRPDISAANGVLDAGEALHATHGALTEALLVRSTVGALAPMTAVSLGLILQSIDRTTAYAQDIAQVGLDRAAIAEIGPEGAVRPTPSPQSHSSTVVETGGRTQNERKSRKPEQQ